MKAPPRKLITDPETRLRDRFGLALLRASYLVDRAYRSYNRLRMLSVLCLASDRFLDTYNEQAYSRLDRYQAGAVDGLFDWEQQAITAYFPAPPSRILIGGAGAGREALALADLGYEVIAFEPALCLLRGFLKQPARNNLQVYRGNYQSLPLLQPVREGAAAVDLRSLPPFDAAVFGYGSYSHLRSQQERVAALNRFRSLAQGPILISFIDISPPGPSSSRNLSRKTTFHRLREPGNLFRLDLGFCNAVVEAEFAKECAEAGLRIAYPFFRRQPYGSPHAVLLPEVMSRQDTVGADLR